MDFNTMWQLLYDHGASAKKEEGTRRFWDTLSEEEQQIAFTTITKKLKEKAFVNFDPIRAIRENIWRAKAPEPTNYRGCVIPQGVQVFSAKYNGVWGMYTREDIDKFHLRVFNMTNTGPSPDIQTT
jgi:hypothetical protein